MAVWLAQLVEHETLNLRVLGSSPRSGGVFTAYCGFQSYVGLLSVPSCPLLSKKKKERKEKSSVREKWIDSGKPFNSLQVLTHVSSFLFNMYQEWNYWVLGNYIFGFSDRLPKTFARVATPISTLICRVWKLNLLHIFPNWYYYYH